MSQEAEGNLRSDPDLFVRIAENAMLVADDLRREYFQSTLGIARALRANFRESAGAYKVIVVDATPLPPTPVAFVDGGISQADLTIATPLVVRAGIFRVKPGERDLGKRETFDHFPLMLGQLRGGLKADRRYGDVVRTLVELGAMVTALEDEAFGDLRILMLHGPLQFVSGPFFEHWFFPEDYEAMLQRDDEERPYVIETLGRFTAWCKRCNLQGTQRCTREIGARHLPAVCMMAFLQHHILERARQKNVLVCGVVERSFGRTITRHVIKDMLTKRPDLLDRLLGAIEMRGRGIAAQVDAVLDATRYNDAVLLALALNPGEALEWYALNARTRIDDERVGLFPEVQTTFVRVTSAKYPMRVEVPAGCSAADRDEVLRRAFEYASLLPGYAFPIGLDIADKYAAIPGWMAKAYQQLILAEYGRLLAGEFVEMTDTEALRSLIMLQGSGRRSRRTRPEV